MQTSGFSPRQRWRATSLVAIPLLTVVLAAFLAYEAWDAARLHRQTAARTIRDYANFAAWNFSVNAKEVVYSTVQWVFRPLGEIEVKGPDQPLPPPSILASDKHSALLCACDSARYYFRIDLRSGELVTSGATPRAALRRWILDTIPKHALAKYDPEWPSAMVFGIVTDTSRGVAYRVVHDMSGKPVAAYGFELCLSEFAPSSYAKVMQHYTLLPPTLTHGAPNDSVPNDSLLSVRVTDGEGHVVYKSKARYPSEFVGEYRLDYLGGVTTKVALNPAIVGDLVIGGLPRSRLPLLLGVFALTVALAAIGVRQLRREYELARIRSDFIASVSHELRTPLAQMRMFAETLLLGRVRSEEEHDRSLQIIDQEARRLTHLVENILQFSRAERKAIRLAAEPVDVASQTRDAMEMFAPIARARRVVLQGFLEEKVVACVDTGAFRQIILNLLDNAVKYGPPGQTVTIRLSRVREAFRLSIEDQGPGVPPAERERIWEPFHRVESAAVSAVAGSGIGLAVVSELVSLHGGRAWVEDAPARGARFVVELPIGTPAANGAVDGPVGPARAPLHAAEEAPVE
jgi:signal transduction histidine kinase